MQGEQTGYASSIERRVLGRKGANREHAVALRAGLTMDLDLHAEPLLERRAEERVAPLRRIPAGALCAHESHRELAEALDVDLDTHAHDLGAVRHTPTDHSNHPQRNLRRKYGP